MRTERAILLDDLYNPNILASRKEEIMSTFPDFMHHKGVCFFAVDDVEKAEEILNEYMSGQYFQHKKDYLNTPIFFKDEGTDNCHGKFEITKPNLFLRELVKKGVRLYDYNINSYESVYGYN